MGYRLSEGQLRAAKEETFIRKVDHDDNDCMVFDPPIDFLPPWSRHKFQVNPVPVLEKLETQEPAQFSIADKISGLQAEQRAKVSWEEMKGVRYEMSVNECEDQPTVCEGNIFDPFPSGNLKPLDDTACEGEGHIMKLPELKTEEDLAYYGFARLQHGEEFNNYHRTLCVRAIYVGKTWRDGKIIGGWFLETHPSMHFWAPSPTCCDEEDSWIIAAIEKPGSVPNFPKCGETKVFKYAKIKLMPGTMLVCGPNAFHASGFREGVYFFGISGGSLETENAEVVGVQPLTVNGQDPKFDLKE